MLLHEADRKKIAAQIKREINAYTGSAYDDGHRTHLGASLIGAKCARYLWYVWRWIMSETFDNPDNKGRMQRLFNRGHLEELRFIEWLRAIGVEVQEVDPATGDQWRVTDHGGHFGGSLDGIGKLPERFGYPDAILLEFKTYNTKSFTELVGKHKGKSKEAKPQHFAQMSVYGFKYGLKYALYNTINKNDDDIHPEIVELDWGLGEELIKKAGDIIVSKVPPPRLHETPTAFDCKWCPAKAVCHEGADYERNCRSCEYAYPADNKQWACGLYQQMIPADFIGKGCPQWRPIGRK